jgi:hypothetical protein
MKKSEATVIITHAAMFDNRQISEPAAKAWADALADVDFDQDALDAVATYYGAAGDLAERRWIMPHHVRHLRAKAREQRVAAAHAIYDGDPGETGAQSAENLRSLTAAAASGQLPVRPVRAALDSGHSVPSPRLLALTEAVGATVPGEQPAIGVNTLGVPCQRCSALKGRMCRSRRGGVSREVHPWRLTDAQRTAAGLPPMSRAEYEQGIAQRREASRQALAESSPTTTPIAQDGR